MFTPGGALKRVNRGNNSVTNLNSNTSSNVNANYGWWVRPALHLYSIFIDRALRTVLDRLGFDPREVLPVDWFL